MKTKIKEFREKMIKKFGRKGFTLIELLAVIVVLAIVLVVTIPSVLTSMNNAKSKQFENAVKSIEKYINDQYQICKSGVGELSNYNTNLFNASCNLIAEQDTILESAGIDKDVIKKNTLVCTFSDEKYIVTAEPGSRFSSGESDSESNNELSFIYVQDDLSSNYESLSPQEKFADDVKRASRWFNNQLKNEETNMETSDAYDEWIEDYWGGVFPTCPSSDEEDLKACFLDEEANGITMSDEVLDAIGIGGKGIQNKSYHSIAFINGSNNKICVVLKLHRSGGSYYETEYTTDFGNIRYMKSDGCY